MAVLATKTVNDHLVYYDNALSWRWLDAFGPSVVKFLEEGFLPLQAANQPAWGTATLVNASTVAAVAGATGAQFIITTAGADNDGANIQVNGESFYFANAWPCYFGARWQISSATQSDILVGLCITDTDLLGAMTDGIYFRKVDGSTSLNFVLEQDSTETETEGVATVAAATWYTTEFYFDGTNVYAYVNGVLVATVAATNANFCNDEYLTPSIHFLTGDNAAITCTVDWIRALQIQQT